MPARLNIVRVLLPLLLTLATFATQADITASAATTQAGAVQADTGKHFLWRISRGHHLLYLVGSVHALNPNDYPLPQAMETAFIHSAVLVEEVDLTSTDPASVQQKALRLGAYPQGQSLQTDMPDAIYQKIGTDAQALGISMARLDRLRPWLASIAIIEMQLTQAGFSPDAGVDHHFADEAQMLYKPVIGLESADYQVRLLARLPAKAQQDLLLQTLHDAGDFNKQLMQLIHAWEQGDTAGLEKILTQDFGGDTLIYQRVIVDRNRAWMPKLERLMQSGKHYFVVVGALHLVGPDGLLMYFKKAGYKVEQL